MDAFLGTRAMTGILWTSEFVAILRELILDRDKSSAIIARELSHRTGLHFTRNSIIGKMHRLKMEKRNSNSHVNLRKPYLNGHKRKSSKQPATTIVLPIDVPLMLSIVEVGPKQCRWPCTPSDAPLILFCGHPTERGSWCALHCRTGYTDASRTKSTSSFVMPNYPMISKR